MIILQIYITTILINWMFCVAFLNSNNFITTYNSIIKSEMIFDNSLYILLSKIFIIFSFIPIINIFYVFIYINAITSKSIEFSDTIIRTIKDRYNE